MSSTITHACFGLSIGLAAAPLLRPWLRARSAALGGGLLGVCPDLDVLTFAVVDYGHFFGHRGFFSLPVLSGLSGIDRGAVGALARGDRGRWWPRLGSWRWCRTQCSTP